MPRTTLEISARREDDGRTVTVRLHNPTPRIAFFERAELLSARDAPETAEEILPVEYDDNYVTVFPGETAEIRGTVPAAGPLPTWVRVTGYNGAPVAVPVR
jgi:exo-1,4-beta-D-glucosaminidase